MATREQFEDEKRDTELQTFRFRQKLERWNAAFQFGCSKVLGLGGVSIGGIDLLFDPSMLHALPHPEYVLSAGLALLTGKSVLKIAGDIAKVLAK